MDTYNGDTNDEFTLYDMVDELLKGTPNDEDYIDIGSDTLTGGDAGTGSIALSDSPYQKYSMGVSNETNDFDGFQIASNVNVSNETNDFGGFQIASNVIVSNETNDFDGFQIASNV